MYLGFNILFFKNCLACHILIDVLFYKSNSKWWHYDVCMVEGPKINNNHETFCITLAKIHFTDTICYLTHKSSRTLNFLFPFNHWQQTMLTNKKVTWQILKHRADQDCVMRILLLSTTITYFRSCLILNIGGTKS